MIKIAIQKGLAKAVAKIDKLAEAFNLKLANEHPDSFLSNSDKPFNYTMTTAPELNPATGLITINMDGRFVNAHTSTSTTAPGPQSTPAMVDGKQREELFIHQSMVSSAMLSDKDMNFNDTNHPNTTAAIFKAFPALKEYYGAEAVISMHL